MGHVWAPLLMLHGDQAVGFLALTYAPAAPGAAWMFHFLVDHRTNAGAMAAPA